MGNRMKLRHAVTGQLLILLSVLAWGGLILGAQSVSAQTCIEDRYFQATAGHLTCTANDVRIARASNIRDIGGNPLESCVSGQTFSFIADFTVQTTATARYDIGLYFATDGDPNHDGALTGRCSTSTITEPQPISLSAPGVRLGSANFIQLDSTPDACGDITTANNPQIVTVRVDNVLCQDTDIDNYLNLPNCTSWRQTGANEICISYLDAYPGSPSKCNCDIAFNVPIRVETGTIEVRKDAYPISLPEPGGDFTFTVRVANTGAYQTVTLERICDDKFGTIAKLASAPDCPAGTLGTITGTDCELPELATGDSYSCTFTANVLSDTPVTITDIVTVYGHDGNTPPKEVKNSDTAQVSITNVPPTATVLKSLVGLQCADVKYRVRVTNESPAEWLQLDALEDSAFGNIAASATGQPKLGADVLASTCQVPQAIAKGSYYECDFTARFCDSPSHTNKVTGTLSDNENGLIDQPSNTLILTIGVSVTTP